MHNNIKNIQYIFILLGFTIIFLYEKNLFVTLSNINFNDTSFIKFKDKIEYKVKKIDFENLFIKTNDELQNIKDNNFKNFEKYSKEQYKKYLLNNLDEETKKEIDYYLNIEIENKDYNIENIPDNILKDVIKSTILYQMAFPENNNLFDFVEDKKERILNIVSLLKSVAKLETGSLDYNHQIFSPTGAYGRYQIVASTLSPTLFKLKLEQDFNIDETLIEYELENQLLLDSLKEFTSSININNKWTQKKEKEMFNKYLKYTKIFNSTSLKYLDNISYKYKNEDTNINLAIETKKELFLNDNQKIDIKKQQEISLKILELMKDSIFQGIASLAVLNDIMKVTSEKYKEKDKVKYKDKIIFNTLSMYNGDSKVVFDKNKNEYIETKNIFGIKGLKYYKNVYEKIYLSFNNISN